MKKYLFLLLIIPLCSFKKGEPLFPKYKHLKPYFHKDVNLLEPSDICLTDSDPTHFFIVGNRGVIAETDSNGKVLRHTKQDGSDYESVCVKDNMIYALDESLRRLDIIDEKTFEVKKSIQIPYGGARNKGIEGLTYIPSQKKFVAVIEKPAMIVELNEQMQLIAQTKLKNIRELSSVTYHDNFLWLLSDEDETVYKVNPADYTIIDQWKIPVINPEGICFDANGNLIIVSDDMSTLFKFKIQ